MIALLEEILHGICYIASMLCQEVAQLYLVLRFLETHVVDSLERSWVLKSWLPPRLLLQVLLHMRGSSTNRKRKRSQL